MNMNMNLFLYSNNTILQRTEIMKKGNNLNYIR